MTYTDYKLTHWEEPDRTWRLVAEEGVVTVTPEYIHGLLRNFFPMGYKEGDITLDVSVESFKAFWESLGGVLEADGE